MVEITILGISILLQFTAAILALQLITVTGKRQAWGLIALAVFFMGVRRSITFFRFIFDELPVLPDLLAETVALVISILMLLGIAWIAPIFHSIKNAAEKLNKSNRLYATLSQVNQAIVRERDKQKLFHEICNIFIEFGKFRFAWIGFVDKENKSVKPVAFSGEGSDYLQSIKISLTDDITVKGPTGRSIREGKSVVFNDLENNPDFAPWREQALEKGYRSSAAFPIQLNNIVIGALNVYAVETHFFDADEIKLLEEAAVDISFALEKFEEEEKRKQAEEALKGSEDKLKNAQRVGKLGHYVLNVITGEWTSSDELDDIFGIDETYQRDVEGWLQIVHPGFAETMTNYLQDHVLKQRRKFDKEYKIINIKTKQEKWVHGLGNLKFDENNNPVELFGTIQDVTERKQSEVALLLSRSRYQTLFNDLPVPLWEEEFSELYAYLEELKESGVRDFRAYFDKNPAELQICVHKVKITDVNQAALKLHHAKNKEELLGNLEKIFTENSYDVFKEELIAIAAGRLEFESEAEVKTLTGETKHIFLRLKIDKSQPKSIRALLATIDITEIKQVEERIARFSRIFEDSLNEIYMFETNTLKFTQVNRAAQRNLGYTMEELQKLTPVGLKPEFTTESFAKLIAPLRKGEKQKIVFETVHKRKDQSVYDVEVHLQLLKYEHEELFAAIIIDITKHNQARGILQKSERQYHALFEDSPVPLWEEDFSLVKKNIDLLKQQGVTDFRKYFNENPQKIIEFAGMVKILEINKAVLTLHEASSKNELLQGLSTVFMEETFSSFKEELITIANGQTRCELEAVVKTINGKEKYVHLNWAVVPGYEKTMERVYLSTVDITERKKMEGALRESENKYRTLFEQSADALLVIEENKFIDCNPATVKMLGYANKRELLETHPSQLSPGKQPDGRGSFEKANEMMAIAFDKGSHRFEWDHKRQNGENFPVEVLLTAIPLGERKLLHVVWRDITERKQAEEEKTKLEEQLRRSQKLETIGTMAGGIAHDFNNILTPIMGYTDMAIAEVPDSGPLKKNLNRVLEGAHRAKDLVEQILLFSKQIEKERNPLSLHLVVKEALKLIRSTIPTTIDIIQRIDSPCDKVLADATQIHQVIVNLCTNAWQAMEEKGGMLTIEMKQVQVDAAIAKFHPNLNEGEYVRLTVQDTGHGMDEAVLERIFEPFFTTKAVDKGTGLGLSVVHGIIQNHQGDILVYSEPGAGTVFNVYLPVVKGAIKIKEDKTEKIVKGDESILVVDDDSVIGKMLKQMLEKFGYTVDLYHKSIEALDALKKQSDRYDLVITDLTMPDLTGLEISEQVHKLQPDLPVIIMTGYGGTLVGVNQESYGIKKVIEKPIVMNELAFAIRDVLDK